MLLQDQPSKLSAADFAGMCREQLEPALAAAAVEMLGAAPSASASSPDGAAAPSSRHPFVLAWRDREAQLRNAVAAERARRRGDSAKPRQVGTVGCDPSIAQGVAAAFAAKDPLSRELAIDAIRWNILEDMQGISPFSEAVVLAYAGKLALNARRFAIDPDKGMGRFRELTAR